MPSVGLRTFATVDLLIQIADDDRVMTNLAERIAAFINECDPFGDHFSEHDMTQIREATDEDAGTGWVIEHRRSQVCEPEYWCGNGWSKDHLRAIRFARKIDAERSRDGFDEDQMLPNEDPHRIAEHSWG